MGIRVGSYFPFDRPLATLRKRERDYLCPRISPFIKADKTNRARFTFAMVLKASLITLLGVGTLDFTGQRVWNISLHF